jgi:translocation and assembly module TamB
MNEARSDKKNQITAQSDVKVIMGKDVQINAFGLQGQLGGNVDTIVRGDYAVGRGELSVTNGKYEAYGQKLDITRGRLLLDATPLDDPGLDIAAERKKEEENITVGVNVRGTLHSPRLSFYSDPSMTQSKILSYLVTGASIEDSQSSTAKSGSAGSSIAMQGGGYLASKLGEQIGLQQVGIESTATNGSALVLGRFLSPRLFVSYGISLTEAINTLKLRYTLNDHWTIKTEHGSFQSVDFEYTIEK